MILAVKLLLLEIGVHPAPGLPLGQRLGNFRCRGIAEQGDPAAIATCSESLGHLFRNPLWPAPGVVHDYAGTGCSRTCTCHSSAESFDGITRCVRWSTLPVHYNTTTFGCECLDMNINGCQLQLAVRCMASHVCTEKRP